MMWSILRQLLRPPQWIQPSFKDSVSCQMTRYPPEICPQETSALKAAPIFSSGMMRFLFRVTGLCPCYTSSFRDFTFRVASLLSARVLPFCCCDSPQGHDLLLLRRSSSRLRTLAATSRAHDPSSSYRHNLSHCTQPLPNSMMLHKSQIRGTGSSITTIYSSVNIF